MFYRNTHVRQINLRIASLAAGLALATVAVAVAVAVAGGSDLLSQKDASNTARVTPRIERISPQFGTAADAVYASQGIRPQTQFASAADAAYDAVGLAYLRMSGVPAAAIDARDHALGLGQPAAGQSFATAADAVYAAESLHVQQEVAAAAVIVDGGSFLGLGQPEGVGSKGPQFGTMADADYASR